MFRFFDEQPLFFGNTHPYHTPRRPSSVFSPFPSLFDESPRFYLAPSFIPAPIGVHDNTSTGNNKENRGAAPRNNKARVTGKKMHRDERQQQGPWASWSQETRTMWDGEEQATTTITRTKDSSGLDEVVEERQLRDSTCKRRRLIKDGQDGKTATSVDDDAEFDKAWRASKAAQRLENRRGNPRSLDSTQQASTAPVTIEQASTQQEEADDSQPTRAQPTMDEDVEMANDTTEQEASNNTDATQEAAMAGPVVDKQHVTSLVGLGFPDTELASLALSICDGDVAKSAVALLKLRRLDVPKERASEALSLLHSNDDLNAVAAELGVEMIPLSH